MLSKEAQIKALKAAKFERLYGKKPAVTPKPEKLIIARDAINKPTVIKDPLPTPLRTALSTAERQSKWRSKNPELARERNRDSMRKSRAKAKTQ